MYGTNNIQLIGNRIQILGFKYEVFTEISASAGFLTGLLLLLTYSLPHSRRQSGINTLERYI